jgi:hypothetical protein
VPGSGTQSEAGVTNERKGLARRKLLRLLAPQTQESPVFFHLTSSDQLVFDAAIEQMSATGFDMVIFSFGNTPTHTQTQAGTIWVSHLFLHRYCASSGSGFQLESTDPEYFAKVKANVAKAQSKGIEVGAYDLIGWSRNSNSGECVKLRARARVGLVLARGVSQSKCTELRRGLTSDWSLRNVGQS